MKNKVGYVECPPTPTGYANCLIFIIENSQNYTDKEWAREEIRKCVRIAARQNPEKWGKKN